MIGYIEATYQAWSQGRSAMDCVSNKETFIRLAAKLYCYSPDEMRSILEAQPWFVSANELDLDG